MKSYSELSSYSDNITNSIAHKPTRYVFVQFSAEMFSEIDRLNRKIKAQSTEIAKIANHSIPYYAFGDNEAACDMAQRLDAILKLVQEELK